MTRLARFAAAALTAVLLPACAAADSPAALAQRMQKAMSTPDADAFTAEFDHYASSDGQNQWAALYLLRKCHEAECTATPGPLTPEAIEKIKKGDPDEEPTAVPEGFIVVTGKKAGSSLKGHLPYAKVGAVYKIVGTRPTAARLAKMKATTAQASTDEALANGFANDPAWKQKATLLPADGGEIGQAFLAEMKPMAAAIKANDADAAAKASGPYGARLYADDEGKPLPAAVRQVILRSQAPRTIVDARVLGGYVKDLDALLIIEGTNGAGSTIRGAVAMRKNPEDGVWQRAGDAGMIEIPKGL